MRTKYEYKWTGNEDLNGYGEETDYIICEDPFDFGDYLENNNVKYELEKVSNTYYVLDEEGERTGEAFLIWKTSKTEEEITE